MSRLRRQQRAGSVSDRSLSAPIGRSAPSTALRAPPPTMREGKYQYPIYVRRSFLLTIVLQLQPRYRKCVYFRGGAYIEVEKVRIAPLRTKGAYISGSDVRTCDFAVIANRLQLRRAERHGGRSLQKAVYVPRFAMHQRRAAGVSRPLRRAGNERQCCLNRTISERGSRSNATGASRPPLAFRISLLDAFRQIEFGRPLK